MRTKSSTSPRDLQPKQTNRWRVDIHEETGVPVLVERTQPLPPMRPGALQMHSSSLDHFEKRVAELDLGNVPIVDPL